MNLPFFIALRYLRSKRSLNIINMVSYISLIGAVCGTAALLIVLSVFNGFENLTGSIYNIFDPELKITPATGKTFVINNVIISEIAALPEVENVALTLDENVLLKYKNQQTIARMRGVDKNYETNTPLAHSMNDGSFLMYRGDYPAAVFGYGVAAKLGLFNLRMDEPVYVNVPKREGKVSLNNPAAAINTLSLLPSGIFEVEKSFDDTYVFAPIEFVQNLLDRESQASAIEIKLKPEIDYNKARKTVAAIAGEEMQVKTRYQQNEALYRMMKSEKLIVYAILILIVIILSFNISGSLSMLITEKKDDITTLKSMGASDKLIRRIFLMVGLLITFAGIAIGLLIGLSICLLQQHFGLLKLPGNSLLIDAYPVKTLFSDLILVISSVAVIGYLASLVAVANVRTKN
ncbi:MAG: ABC transporter permease [Prevotellaceae bacterium]|jgi:ABC-type lipoprotein release transport system permease subunit|nr:ABC transporter permease [Prevotellaceae bacterium]